MYEFKPSLATPITFYFDLRRNVPYFYDTFWVQKYFPVAALDVIPDAPWWSAALTHTIACGRVVPQPSAQVSSPHHGQCH